MSIFHIRSSSRPAATRTQRLYKYAGTEGGISARLRDKDTEKLDIINVDTKDLLT